VSSCLTAHQHKFFYNSVRPTPVDCLNECTYHHIFLTVWKRHNSSILSPTAVTKNLQGIPSYNSLVIYYNKRGDCDIICQRQSDGGINFFLIENDSLMCLLMQ